MIDSFNTRMPAPSACRRFRFRHAIDCHFAFSFVSPAITPPFFAIFRCQMFFADLMPRIRCCRCFARHDMIADADADRRCRRQFDISRRAPLPRHDSLIRHFRLRRRFSLLSLFALLISSPNYSLPVASAGCIFALFAVLFSLFASFRLFARYCISPYFARYAAAI